MYTKKGVVKPDTVVVKILEFKNDWKLKEPDGKKRNAACKALGLEWNNFSACASPSNSVNGKYNMGLDKYLLYLKAAGMEDCEDKYWDTEADPKESIPFRRRSSKSKKSDNKTTSNLPDYKAKSNKPTEPKKVTPNLPNYLDQDKPLGKSKEPQVVLFEMPGKSNKKPNKPDNSTPVKNFKSVNNPKPKTKELAKFTAPKAPAHAAPGTVRVLKSGDCIKKPNKSDVSPQFNLFMKKMNSFRTHLAVYCTALHLTADDVICVTSVINFREIRDGKAEIQLYDYIVLSEYLIKIYKTANEDAKIMFRQLADLFNDIYNTTFYFKDTKSGD